MSWVVPRAFEGETIAILASSPSMSAQVAEQVRAAAVPAIVINTTFRLAPWAWMLYAADREWWLHLEHADAHAFAGLRVSCTSPDAAPHAGPQHFLLRTGLSGFDPTPGTVRTGGNSGYQALHIAVHSGAKRVLLCGFEMRGGDHWHGAHPRGLKMTSEINFASWRGHMNSFAPLLKERGVEVLNCTPFSALNCFPAASLLTELDRASSCLAR